MITISRLSLTVKRSVEARESVGSIPPGGTSRPSKGDLVRW